MFLKSGNRLFELFFLFFFLLLMFSEKCVSQWEEVLPASG